MASNTAVFNLSSLNGTNGNDTLIGSDLADIINGLAGSDRITGNQGNDTLTGGGGEDKFVYNLDDGTDAIVDFGGVGTETNPTAAVITEVDTLIFQGAGLSARNLLFTQNGSNLEIAFEEVANTKVILQNFTLENLDNLRKSTGASVDLDNILFDGQTSIQDSFDVFNANSTQTTIFNENTVTFLNDLNNNVNGFDNSDDVINGQGGNDYINGKSGNDLLRDGSGNNTLNSGASDDNLNVDHSTGDNLLSGDDGNDTISASGEYPNPASGNNTLNGGAGDDILNVDNSTGDKLLSGGDGNDTLSASNNPSYPYGFSASIFLGNNTLNGGVDDDTLDASFSTGDNLLSGGSGNDSLSASGSYDFIYGGDAASGNNTLNGGSGDDTLNIDYSTGDNLLFGGDGNDSLSGSGYYYEGYYYIMSGNNTLNGGAGNDTLSIDYSKGDNLLSGGNGNDILSAIAALGSNTLDGGNGNDILTSGNGNDTLYGGNGTDTFVFNSFNDGVDILYDFNATNERIQVLAAGFGGGLSTPSLSASQFTQGASATTIAQRFIYDNTTGALYFDQDGSASAFTQVQIAQLSAGVSLTKNNFAVV
ncbi:MAG: calcium-binding protein [Nostoc sp.]